MNKEDPPALSTKNSKAGEPHSKEIQEKIAAFRKGIGKAMVENLNRNVPKEAEADEAAKTQSMLGSGMDDTERAAFHPDFSRALVFTTELHARQVRKQTNVPYISHLISVAGLVLEYGGGRNAAIGALLHDSIEDCGVEYPGGVAALRERIASDFGPQVLAIVEGCTDSEVIPKPPWLERKKRYVAHIRDAPPTVRLVSCADKLHNARSIVADLRVMGNALFDRFNGGKDGTLWYYEALATAFMDTEPKDLAGELSRTVVTMKALAG